MDWHRTTGAIRVLQSLKPTDLYVRLDRPLIGPDALVYSGGVIDQLGEIREQYAETLNGCTFREAHSHGLAAAGEWLDVLERQPTVQAVLTERFGDVNALRGWGAEIAQEVMRAGLVDDVARGGLTLPLRVALPAEISTMDRAA